jgi:hypothetical protein
LVCPTLCDLHHYWPAFKVFRSEPRKSSLQTFYNPLVNFTRPSESFPSAAAESLIIKLSGFSTASLRLPVPSALKICRIHFPQAYRAHYVTLSGFYTLLEFFSSTYRGVLFHTLNAPGIFPFRVFPWYKAGILSVPQPS